VADGVLQVFQELATAESPVDFLFKHPVLLSRSWQRHVLAGPLTAAQSDAMARLVRLTGTIDKAPEKYPVGPGPIEQVLQRILRGDLTESHALKLVAGAEIHQLLSPFYVRLLSITAERKAQQGDWKPGLTLQRLILAALDARRADLQIDQAEMDFIAVVHWLDIVARAVWDVPDGQLFADARQRGEHLAPSINDPGGFYGPAEILQRLGVLHLDPYVSGRANQGYQRQWRQWQERLDLARTARFEGGATDQDRIPLPEAALPAAVDYFRRALPHRAGRPRAATLKAMLQALVWQLAVKIVPDAAEVKRVGDEVLELLTDDDSVNQRTEVRALLRWHATEAGATARSSATATADAQALLERPLDHWLEKSAPQEVVHMFTGVANAVAGERPELALQLWLAVKSLVLEQDDQIKEIYYRMGRRIVVGALAPHPLPGAGRPLAARADAVEALGHDPTTTAAMLLGLMADSPETDEEAVALTLFARLAKLDAAFTQQFLDLLHWLKAGLEVGAAVNARNQGKIADAVAYNMSSAHTFAATGQPRVALDPFERALDLIENGDQEAIISFAVRVPDLAPMLERELGNVATSRLQFGYRQVLDRLASTGPSINPNLLLILLDVAKGNLFARATATGTPLSWLGTPAAVERKERIAEAGQEVRAEGVVQIHSALDDEWLLAGFIGTDEKQGGGAASERLRNLQIEFDAELGRQLALRDAPKETWIPSEETLQTALGPQSVFLSTYIGSLKGNLAVYTFFATREELGLTIGSTPEMPSATVLLSSEDIDSATNLMGPLVAETRKAIQLEPGPRVASTEALQQLESRWRDFFGGGLDKHLERFRQAGKTHIYICPHGPYHFLPYHLLGTEERPLAAEWAVTYLPNMRLLNPSRRTDNGRKELITVGLDFSSDNARGLPALSGPEAEAREIAATANAPALTGNAATRDAVLDALAHYRWIHIASHGELQVSSPSFQCIYLALDKEDDAALYAHDLLHLDLRGVDLVTLSVCETALGRVDYGDNLRGISANLLIAGVATIIGTLWPVETNATRFFFATFYECLRGAVTKGEAFHKAQAETRSRYPQYRDWGAFYLVGRID